MTHLLDSDIVIPYLAGELGTLQLVSGLVSGGIAISLITYMETMDGIFRSVDPVAAEADFAAWMTSGVPVLPFDVVIARRTARLRADLAARGRRTRTRALDLNRRGDGPGARPDARHPQQGRLPGHP